MKKLNGKIYSGALSLGVGAFLAKFLGAIYRVPLTNLLGGTGLGLYQMVFPVYTVLLDFSGAGVPSALSKIIASEKDSEREKQANGYLRSAIKLLTWFGVISTAVMIAFARPLAKIQGNVDAYLGYIFLAPAVLLVSLISCFRGYFQGLFKMTPTATSQVVEQLVKLLFGLLLVYLFVPNVKWAVAGATLAITLSELFALIYLYIAYLKRKKRYALNFAFNKSSFKPMVKSIIKLTVPITLVGIFIPLSQVIDSFLVLNILGAYNSNATSLYGLLSGVVATVIGLPVAVCYGVATVAIPAVSKLKSVKEQNRNGAKTLVLTSVVAIPCAIFCYLFAPFIINLLFRGLSEWEKNVAVNLLKLCSPCILLLSFLQTGNAILIGKGKPYYPIISLGIGIAVKEFLNFILLKNPELNIYGGAIAIIACYFVVCLINLILIFKKHKERDITHANKSSCRREYAS